MGRATLLVADRNPRFLEKTQEILGQAGHTMLSATDGEAARRLITRELDGVLVHAALPGLSGFALSRLVKEHDPTLPVVVMLSAEDPRAELEAKRAGADNWLVRPLKRTELLFVVRELVQMRGTYLRAARALEERDLARDLDGPVGDGARLVQFELFKRLLGIELKRSQRYGFPLALLLAGLDDLPPPTENDVLAAASRSAIRDIDIPVAFGPSDVLVVMPHTDLDGARLVAERIRKRVRATRAQRAPGSHTGKRPAKPLTASIGVVAAQGGQRLTFATLLAQATRAQKSAARAGGDRVMLG
jgi:PleD family two-component response regulator